MFARIVYHVKSIKLRHMLLHHKSTLKDHFKYGTDYNLNIKKQIEVDLKQAGLIKSGHFSLYGKNLWTIFPIFHFP